MKFRKSLIYTFILLVFLFSRASAIVPHNDELPHNQFPNDDQQIGQSCKFTNLPENFIKKHKLEQNKIVNCTMKTHNNKKYFTVMTTSKKSLHYVE